MTHSIPATDTDPRAVVVYGASSPYVPQVYVDAATRLGKALAEAGLTVVTGGGRAGLMAATIDAAMDAGGRTIGVIPDFMVKRHWNHDRLSETVVVDSMHTRKATMARLSRAAIALPGGCGTFEELLEIITWRQLGLFQGHVVVLNIDGYYDPLIQLLRQSVDQHFMNPDHTQLWHFTASVDTALEIVCSPVAKRSFSQKL